MTRIQIRRGTTSQWATSNPILAEGEPGIDTTTGDYKFGDGALTWSALRSRYAPHQPGVTAQSGMYFSPAIATSTVTSFPLDTPILVPIVVSEPLTFNRIGFEVTTVGASATPRLGVFAWNGAAFSRLLDAGTVSGATLGFIESTISLALQPGLYWLAFTQQVATCSVRSATGKGSASPFTTGATAVSAAPGDGVQATATSGAYPATLAATGVSSLAPRLAVKVA